jgi:hypothetical protein
VAWPGVELIAQDFIHLPRTGCVGAPMNIRLILEHEVFENFGTFPIVVQPLPVILR